jgi:hypothetical protein
MRAFLFDAERRARCSAALARDLAATVADTETRRRYLAQAASLMRGAPGTSSESLLIKH